MNKAMIESYLRNLFGVVLALVTTTMASKGLASPLDFGVGEWLTVANGLWAAAIPTALRWVNAKDPAFGRVAEVVAVEVGKKIAKAAEEAPAKAAKPATQKAASKTTAKKTTPKK